MNENFPLPPLLTTSFMIVMMSIYTRVTRIEMKMIFYQSNFNCIWQRETKSNSLVSIPFMFSRHYWFYFAVIEFWLYLQWDIVHKFSIVINLAVKIWIIFWLKRDEFYYMNGRWWNWNFRFNVLKTSFFLSTMNNFMMLI